MNIFVLNKDLEVIYVIDSYSSLIWTDRYQEAGDFEIYIPMNKNLLEYFKQDYYLWRNDSEHVMIIEKLLIEADAEDGDKLTVTGRSLESILERRVVWGLKNLSGNLQNGIETLLNESIISPSKPERKISNFIFNASTNTNITSLTIDTQYTGDNLYDIVTSLCKANNIGFKITLNSDNQFVFELYSGEDRSYDQFNNPYVVFSPNFDNIISSNYVESRSSLKNVTLVGGEGEGAYRRYTAVGNLSGLDRREMFTDARDISSDIDEDISESFNFAQYPSQVYSTRSSSFVTDNRFNSAMVDVSGYIGRTIEITIPKYSKTAGASLGYATVFVNSSKEYMSTLLSWEVMENDDDGDLETYEFIIPEGAQYLYTSMFSQTAIDEEVYSGELDDFECFYIKLSNTEYINLLRQRGKEDLSENIEVVSFEGEADTSRMFVYGEDFFVGDVVSVADSYGHDTKARILEIVTSENEDGSTSMYPTFSTMDYVPSEDDPDDPDEPVGPDDPNVNYYIPQGSSRYVTSDGQPYIAVLESTGSAPGGYNGIHTGPEIDAAISAVQNKETSWDSKLTQAQGDERYLLQSEYNPDTSVTAIPNEDIDAIIV